MRPAPLVLAALLLASGAAAQDTLGTLTVYGPGDGAARSMAFDALSMWLPALGVPGRADADVADARTITVSGPVDAPDPDLLAWAVASGPKRRVTLEVRDDPDGRTRSTYELEGARAVTLAIDHGGRGSSQQILILRSDHLRINGQVVH